MKKRFLIISLIVGLFLLLSSGAAIADTCDGTSDDPCVHDRRVIIEPTTDIDNPTLHIKQPYVNNTYDNPNDAIPLLVEGAEDLNTIAVIRSSGVKPDGDLAGEPTEAELRFDYGSDRNAAIYTQGIETILRLKPLEVSTLQEVQIEGQNGGDTIVRIAAKGNSAAALAFAEAEIVNNEESVRYGIDIAKIYRPASPDDSDLRVWMSGINDDVMTFDGETGNVGIGTAAPGWKFQIDGAGSNPLFLVNGDGTGTTNRIAQISNGGADKAFVVLANGKVGIGTTLPGWKFQIDGAGSNPLFLVNGDGTGTTNRIVQISNGGADKAFVVLANGNVGIGTTNPGSYKLYVAGTAYSTGGWASPSDINLKKNITSIDDSLNKVLQLEGVSFEWKTEEYPEKGFSEGRHYGVIAQKIEKVLPEVVKEGPEGEKAVAYTEIIPVLIEAMKEQQKIIDGQQVAIEELKSEIEQLKAGS